MASPHALGLVRAPWTGALPESGAAKRATVARRELPVHGTPRPGRRAGAGRSAPPLGEAAAPLPHRHVRRSLALRGPRAGGLRPRLAGGAPLRADGEVLDLALPRRAQPLAE